MKHIYIILTLVFMLFLNACMVTKNQKASNSDFLALEDRYFGQKPPSIIPVVFAPDIVSPEGLFEGGSFSPDM